MHRILDCWKFPLKVLGLAGSPDLAETVDFAI